MPSCNRSRPETDAPSSAVLHKVPHHIILGLTEELGHSVDEESASRAGSNSAEPSEPVGLDTEGESRVESRSIGY